MNKPGIVSEKWTSSQAHTTSDAQSKLYNTGRKKPDGIDHTALTEQMIQQVRNASIARRTLNILRNNRRVRRVEPDRPMLPGDDEGVATKEILQRERHHPVTQRIRHSLWKSHAPTVRQIMDKVKKVLRLKEEEEESGPNGGSQPKNRQDTGKQQQSP